MEEDEHSTLSKTKTSKVKTRTSKATTKTKSTKIKSTTPERKDKAKPKAKGKTKSSTKTDTTTERKRGKKTTTTTKEDDDGIEIDTKVEVDYGDFTLLDGMTEYLKKRVQTTLRKPKRDRIYLSTQKPKEGKVIELDQCDPAQTKLAKTYRTTMKRVTKLNADARKDTSIYKSKMKENKEAMLDYIGVKDGNMIRDIKVEGEPFYAEAKLVTKELPIRLNTSLEDTIRSSIKRTINSDIYDRPFDPEDLYKFRTSEWEHIANHVRRDLTKKRNDKKSDLWTSDYEIQIHRCV